MDETVGVLISSACSAGCWENCTSYIQESLQNKIHVGNLQSWSNVHSYNAGLLVDNRKSVIVKSRNIVWGERTDVPKFEQRDTIDKLLQSKFIHFFTFFPTALN